eukprot:6842-Heterococcus_DN1.PRE.8
MFVAIKPAAPCRHNARNAALYSAELLMPRGSIVAFNGGSENYVTQNCELLKTGLSYPAFCIARHCLDSSTTVFCELTIDSRSDR